MKKLLTIISFLFLLSGNPYGQTDSLKKKEINLNLVERYTSRGLKQKRVAWSLLSAGVAVDALSFAFYPRSSDSFSSGFNKAFIQAGLLVLGSAAIITSIPLFIASGINKRKAMLIVNTGKVELTPRWQSSEWQVNAGLAFHF